MTKPHGTSPWHRRNQRDGEKRLAREAKQQARRERRRRMQGPGQGTWTCHVCGKVRDDAFISVMKFDIGKARGLGPGQMVQNVRYCNDDPACAIGAREVVTEPAEDVRDPRPDYSDL